MISLSEAKHLASHYAERAEAQGGKFESGKAVAPTHYVSMSVMYSTYALMLIADHERAS